jgi:hypothetical protein
VTEGFVVKACVVAQDHEGPPREFSRRLVFLASSQLFTSPDHKELFLSAMTKSASMEGRSLGQSWLRWICIL